jgi:membrane protein DedA with SNARE-associated domain
MSTLAFISSAITKLMLIAGYFGLFLLMAGESALLPIPSEIVLPFAGFLVFSGKMSLLFVILAAVAGQLFGSIVAYTIGYYGGRPLVLKYTKRFPFAQKHFFGAEAWFKKYGSLTVFFGRLLPIVRTIISFPAGVMKLNFGKFLIYSLLGIVSWTTALVLLGFKLGENWQNISVIFHKFQFILIALIGIAFFLIWLILKKQKHAHKANT